MPPLPYTVRPSDSVEPSMRLKPISGTQKSSLSLLTCPLSVAKPAPVRSASRFGLKPSMPRSARSPAQTMAAGLVAPPRLSWAIAREAPPMPLALRP